MAAAARAAVSSPDGPPAPQPDSGDAPRWPPYEPTPRRRAARRAHRRTAGVGRDEVPGLMVELELQATPSPRPPPTPHGSHPPRSAIRRGRRRRRPCSRRVRVEGGEGGDLGSADLAAVAGEVGRDLTQRDLPSGQHPDAGRHLLGQGHDPARRASANVAVHESGNCSDRRSSSSTSANPRDRGCLRLRDGRRSGRRGRTAIPARTPAISSGNTYVAYLSSSSSTSVRTSGSGSSGSVMTPSGGSRPGRPAPLPGVSPRRDPR